jgi:CNT family concentrative nucleoside transporter
MDIISILRGALGIISLLAIAYLVSSARSKVNWRLVGMGLVLQFVLAILLLKVPFVRAFFQIIVDFFVVMIESTEESAKFLFGELAEPGKPYGFAFIVLPTIIFFSALSSLLYYLGILQRVVYGFAWMMKKTMKLSGAESLAAAANVFIGQTEAPLVVKPYLEKMTKSEIMSLMTGGMATIAGGVFGAYMAMLGGDDPEGKALFGMHLLTASIISAPAAIVAAKIIQPETRPDVIDEGIEVPSSEAGSNLLDALAQGTTDGLKLAVNVGAMLLAFMAFVFLANHIFVGFGSMTGINQWIAEASNGQYDALTVQYVIGLLFSPLAWLIGVESQDMIAIGQTLGEKTILNEFIGYLSLVELKEAGVLAEKSIIIATYALCGFANFASIGIQIGGIGAIAPGQRKTLTQFGFKALIGGTLAALMTASIAGMLY